MLTDFGEIWLEHARITKKQKCSGILQFWIFFGGGGGGDKSTVLPNSTAVYMLLSL